jgi:integrase
MSVPVAVQHRSAKAVSRLQRTHAWRTLPLPSFAVTVLSGRRSLPYLGQQTMVFPSTAGTWRDPDNFRARWREVRDELGVPDATSHSFRKTVATLIDDEGLSARIGADHLGHSRISTT